MVDSSSCTYFHLSVSGLIKQRYEITLLRITDNIRHVPSYSEWTILTFGWPLTNLWIDTKQAVSSSPCPISIEYMGGRRPHSATCWGYIYTPFRYFLSYEQKTYLMIFDRFVKEILTTVHELQLLATTSYHHMITFLDSTATKQVYKADIFGPLHETWSCALPPWKPGFGHCPFHAYYSDEMGKTYWVKLDVFYRWKTIA